MYKFEFGIELMVPASCEKVNNVRANIQQPSLGHLQNNLRKMCMLLLFDGKSYRRLFVYLAYSVLGSSTCFQSSSSLSTSFLKVGFAASNIFEFSIHSLPPPFSLA